MKNFTKTELRNRLLEQLASNISAECYYLYEEEGDLDEDMVEDAAAEVYEILSTAQK